MSGIIEKAREIVAANGFADKSKHPMSHIV